MKKSALELPDNLDAKARKKLEAYHRKIKNADVFVDCITNPRGIPTIRLSYETRDKRNRGYMEVNHYYAN
jgi:hypothetical protein